MTLSEDGSYTAYSKEYEEHYHSTKDGALVESLLKHVIPVFRMKKNQKKVVILDICFGLGFNSLATIYYVQKHFPHIKIEIYSPELDESLVETLTHFKYPVEFDGLQDMITGLSTEGTYKSEQVYVELFLGDAREYIRSLGGQTFDVVYQDAFSPSKNPTLWTQEYFGEIKRLIKLDGLITTYSTALATRLALYKNGFNVYINKGENFRKATLASLSNLRGFEEVDMKHKISCNPDASALRD